MAATHMEPHTAAGLEGAVGRVESAILSTQPSTERRASPPRWKRRHVSARSSAGHRLHRIRSSDVGSDNPEQSFGAASCRGRDDVRRARYGTGWMMLRIN